MLPVPIATTEAEALAHLDNPLLIHVAAESENRGRVVLAAQTGSPHPVAVGAAIAFARAFDARIDCLLIECPQILALTAHSFAREVSHGGRIAPLSLAGLADTISGDTLKAREAISAIAAKAGVRIAMDVQRDDLNTALIKACATHGPWNLVVLADPVRSADGTMLRGLLEDIGGATGLVVIGPQAAQCAGDVVVVVEDVERLPQMIRAGERLIALSHGQSKVQSRICLLLVGKSQSAILELDGLVRLLLPDLTGSLLSPVETCVLAGSLFGLGAIALKRRDRRKTFTA